MKKILYVILLTSIFLFAQEDVPILEVQLTGIGKSMDKETAIRLACQNALHGYLNKILPRDISKKMRGEIERYLAENYQKYFLSTPQISKWDGWECEIVGKIEHERFVTDIHHQVIIPDVQDRIVIIDWPQELSNVPLSYANNLQKIAQNQLEMELKKYGMEFTTSQRIQDEWDMEIKETGTMANTEESSFLADNKHHLYLKLGLVVQAQKKVVLDTRLSYWQVKLYVEIYPKREKNKIFSGIFPPEDASYGTRLVQSENDSQMLCEQLVAKVSRIAGQNVADYLRNYRPMPKTVHTIYFVGFSRNEKNKILRVFDQILAKQQADTVQRGTGAGDSLKIILDTPKRINALQDLIVTYCLSEGVSIALDPSRQDDASQTFYYIPKEQE